MPFKQGKKYGIMVYVTPETFDAIDKMRGNYISVSAQCAMILEEVIADGE